MIEVQVLGSGCKRCEDLYKNAQEAAARMGACTEAVHVEKIQDPEVFFKLGVYVTPALVINGEVISTGKLMTADEIEAEIIKPRPQTSGEVK